MSSSLMLSGIWLSLSNDLYLILAAWQPRWDVSIPTKPFWEIAFPRSDPRRFLMVICMNPFKSVGISKDAQSGSLSYIVLARSAR